MRRSIGLQIADLETIPSIFEQELTIEEAKQFVGGITSFCGCSAYPINLLFPDLPNMFPDPPNTLGEGDASTNR